MLDFSFNTAKSVALRIGPRFKHVCAPLMLAGADLQYVHQTKYLGVLLKASRQLNVHLIRLKLNFIVLPMLCAIEPRMPVPNQYVFSC